MALVLACSAPDAVVVVTVEAGTATPGTTHLRLALANGGLTDTRVFPEATDTAVGVVTFPATLALILPRSRSGRLDVAVEALNASGVVLGHGAGTTTTAAGKRSELTITLAAGASPCGGRQIDSGATCDDGNRQVGNGGDAGVASSSTDASTRGPQDGPTPAFDGSLSPSGMGGMGGTAPSDGKPAIGGSGGSMTGSGGTAGMSGAGGTSGTDGTPGTGGTGGRGGASGAGVGGSSVTDMSPLLDVPAPSDAIVARDAPPTGIDMRPTRRALLVAGNPNALGPGDVRIRMRLEAKSFAVTLGDDDDMNANGSGMGMVVISNSVMTPKLMGRFRDVAIPLICMDPFVFADLKMTGVMQGVDFEDETATQVAIADAGHVMAAGLTGVITVVTAAQDLPWGLPSSGAERVATVVNVANQNQVNRVAIFGYPPGATMIDGTIAPARRVGFFASDSVAARLTADGEKLLDAAIDWASR